MTKVGITERGDPSLDFSWVEKLFDINIIISKNITTEKMQEVLLSNKGKIILHATCTGHGRSVLEPNIPTMEETFSALRALVEKGFPSEQIVLRIDPIIPTFDGIDIAEDVLFNAPEFVKRVRYSIIDMYPHVIERFEKLGIKAPYGNRFSPSKEQIEMVSEMLSNYRPRYLIESCAEKDNAVGCVSKKDFDILGIAYDNGGSSRQRKTCLCPAGKTELLNSKERCPYKCSYCFWKD